MREWHELDWEFVGDELVARRTYLEELYETEKGSSEETLRYLDEITEEIERLNDNIAAVERHLELERTD